MLRLVSILAIITGFFALNKPDDRGVKLVILGNVQDGGSPHAGCRKDCCKELFQHPDSSRKVVCIGLIDFDHQLNALFEATPDLPSQMKRLHRLSPFAQKETPDAIFPSHAHIGHYAGLMYLGREAMNAHEVPVYAMPRMKDFLEKNGPWSQLVSLKNIEIRPLENEQWVDFGPQVKVEPIRVPHRDEYSETVGFLIKGPQKTALFIPDIDKWEKWDKSITDMIRAVDYAFVDATFFDGAEINNRSISEIPHPFIQESMALFKELPASEKDKVYFIHLNHTNPALDTQSRQSEEIRQNGFHVARFGDEFEL